MKSASRPPTADKPGRFMTPDELTLETALVQAEQFVADIPAYPGDYQGRGIVICGGGTRYFTCAWVCINHLRRLGCNLPIQLWHLGADELDETMKDLLAPLQVECIDGMKVRKQHPVRNLKGWELKPYAIIHSPFREVLFLDADNVPVVNPEFLFETQPYQQTGAIFWPDYLRLASTRLIWGICGVAYRDEPEFETGQIVVDKERCWRSLQLTLWYNAHSDFFYRHIHGDKETFHMAWRKIGQDYAMPPYPIHPLPHVMCQHDFDGRRLFQHRNMDKWSFFGRNKQIPDFVYEPECLKYVETLRTAWSGRPGFSLANKPKKARLAAEELVRQVLDYKRVGYDHRPMTFLPNGRVGEGTAACEVFWDVQAVNGDVLLDILSEKELTCRLQLDPDGIWRGKWERFEQMPIELTPQPLPNPRQERNLKRNTGRLLEVGQFDATTKLSYCITCMGRLHHLKHTLPFNLNANRDLPVEFVLLDYNSADGLREWVEANLSWEIASGKLVYYGTHAPQSFNPPHAKNLAHRQATGDIVCNLDADNFAPTEFTKYLLELFQADSNLITHGSGREGFFGRIALPKACFLRLGGYNEELGTRWGYEDSDLVERAKLLGLKEITLPGQFGTVLAHSDSERLQNLSSCMNPSESHRINAELSRREIAAGRLIANQGTKWGTAPLETIKRLPEVRPATGKQVRAKKRVCLVTVASQPIRYFPQFLASCQRYHTTPVILGMGVNYGGNRAKIKLLKQFIEKQGKDYSHLVFCDAYDTILAESLETILERFSALGAPIVFSAERNCFPNKSKASEYPETVSPYKYLNSGVWVGEMSAIHEMYQFINVQSLNDAGSDQAIFTELFLKRSAPIALDYECQIAQSLFMAETDIECRNGRLRNKTFGHYPCVIHGNGGVDMTAILADIGLQTSTNKDTPGNNEQAAFEYLTTRMFDYHRIGYDRRTMDFLPNGMVGCGRAACEYYWCLRTEHGKVICDINSRQGLTVRLFQDKEGIWKGRWEQFEKMPVELTPGPVKKFPLPR